MAKTKHLEQEASLTQAASEDLYDLILHNDDIHTFNFVIDSLIEVCNHSPVQAEQCAMTVHFKGQCDLMQGHYSELLPPYNKLKKKGLTVSID